MGIRYEQNTCHLEPIIYSFSLYLPFFFVCVFYTCIFHFHIFLFMPDPSFNCSTRLNFKTTARIFYQANVIWLKIERKKKPNKFCILAFKMFNEMYLQISNGNFCYFIMRWGTFC